MSEDESDGPAVRKPADSFRLAGSAASDGLRTLYEWCRAWFERRHSSVRLSIAVAVWFGGNWTYNRIAPTIIGILKALLRRLSFELSVAPTFGPLENRTVLASVSVLLILLITVIVQNRAQTQKLKTIESKVTTMSGSTRKSADGGTRELPPTGPRAIGGAIIGAIIGAVIAIWLGPGSILAGTLIGFTTGDRWDIRAYERDPHTPDLNRQ